MQAGDEVSKGEVIGLVGNSGNSSAPHLHFHVMDGPSSFAANGRPYVIESFTASRRGRSTQNLDTVENSTKPLSTLPIEDPGGRAEELAARPLDR